MDTLYTELELEEDILGQFSENYDRGDLNVLKGSIVPFLKKHILDFRNFVKNFESKNQAQPIDVMVKFFLISMNMPINFKFYLDYQSKAMLNELGPEIEHAENKTELVSDWIQKKAANYRTHSILQQIYCFERCKKEILPQIEALLKEDANS